MNAQLGAKPVEEIVVGMTMVLVSAKILVVKDAPKKFNFKEKVAEPREKKEV